MRNMRAERNKECCAASGSPIGPHHVRPQYMQFFVAGTSLQATVTYLIS